MKKALPCTLLPALLIACSGGGGGTALEGDPLLPFNPATGNYQLGSVSFAGRNWRLLDYSYAGYRLGTASPGSGVPCASVSISGSGDITAELQAAVNNVGNAGGGSVLIPAGQFTVSGTISVPFNNVSIVGAGSGLTFLRVPATYNPTLDDFEGVFTLGKAAGSFGRGWVDNGATLAEVTRAVAAGSHEIVVADAAELTVGRWIVVSQYFWPEFAQRNSGGAWPGYTGFADSNAASRESLFGFLRQVTATNGQRVTLDAPIPWPLDPADNAVRVRDGDPPLFPLRSNTGIAGVSIEFADNDNASGRPAGAGVYMEGIRDGWIHDVQVRNFPRYGIFLNSAARVTIRDSAVYGAQDYGVGGYGDGIYVYASQNILVQGSRTEDTRHGFISEASLTSMLVITRSEAAASRLNDDAHFRLSQGLLHDAHLLSYGSALLGTYRGSLSNGAHECVGSAAYWNVRGDGARGGYDGGALHINPSSDGSAIVAGATALDVFDVGVTTGSNERINPAPGLQVSGVKESPGPGSRDRNVLYSSIGTPVEPASVYEALRDARIETVPADFSTQCRAAPVQGAFTPALDGGPGTLVFDGDHLGYAAIPGNNCSVCEPDSTAQNATAGGSESYAVQMGAGDFTIGVVFRGPTRPVDASAELRLSVYPTAPGLQFRLRLTQQELPEGTPPVSRGEYIVDGLTAGEWTQVTIPTSGFDSAPFNTVELRSLGPASSTLFYLDDMRLVGP